MGERIEQLRALAERLEKATAPDREIDVRALVTFSKPEGIVCNGMDADEFLARAAACNDWITAGSVLRAPHCTSYIDAALALVERLLPGMECCVTRRKDGTGWSSVGEVQKFAPTPALAILRALVAALISSAEATQ